MLESQLGCLQVEADAEVPSTFGYQLQWLTCKLLLARRLVALYLLLHFAIDLYVKVFVAFFIAQVDIDVDVSSFAVFEAEV